MESVSEIAAPEIIHLVHFLTTQHRSTLVLRSAEDASNALARVMATCKDLWADPVMVSVPASAPVFSITWTSTFDGGGHDTFYSLATLDDVAEIAPSLRDAAANLTGPGQVEFQEYSRAKRDRGHLAKSKVRYLSTAGEALRLVEAKKTVVAAQSMSGAVEF